ncbi:ATP-binding protein [Corynebacterium xerosis]|uniref:ATP-binding protein n=1 Tax=Corynebacterium xerosis TaxID=1725 RepID=UPI00365A04E1
MTTAIHPGQFRLSRVQLINWGTFGGYVDVDVPRQGFLITGGSGSGKSTLIDAISTVLVPPQNVHFNAAAQQTSSGRGGRSLVSYIRGAWRRGTDDSGDITQSYLRPKATCTGICLTYSDGDDSDTSGAATEVSLAALYYLKAGDNSQTGVRRLFGVLDGPVELRDMYPYLTSGIDVRGLKKKWSNGSFTDKHSVFSGRFRKKLGIANEEAQLLLHRTLSAKSLGSLDQLFRDYMLEEPLTFGFADTAVEQFGELREAYDKVQDIRAQISALEPLPKHAAARREALAGTRDAELMSNALPRVQNRIHAELLREDIAAAEARLASLRAALSDRESAKKRAVAALKDTELRLAQIDGGRHEALIAELGDIRDNIERRRAKLEGLTSSIHSLGGQAPASNAEFNDLLADAARRLADFDAEFAALQSTGYDLSTDRRDARSAVAKLSEELAALQKQSSNIDMRHIAVRERLCRELGASTGELPFIGELLQVRATEVDWRPAIERLLGGFAQTLVVPESLKDRASAWINDNNLQVRLVYRVVPLGAAPRVKRVSARALPRKLDIADGPYREWVTAQLHERFNYECVDSPRDMFDHDRALTRQGLAKHSKDRFEKDDRSPLGSTRNYRLGWSNDEKVETLRADLAAAKKVLRTREEVLRTHDSKVKRLQDDRQCAAEIRAVEWSDIDVAGAEKAADDVAARIASWSMDNPDIAKIQVEYNQASLLEKTANEEYLTARDAVTTAANRHSDMTGQLEQLEREQSDADAPDDADATRGDALVEKLFSSLTRRPTAAGMERLGQEVLRSIHELQHQHQRKLQSADNAITRVLGAYITQWPSERSDLRAEPSFVGDGVKRLETLRSDGLARFHNRFMELMNDLSGRNLGQLSAELRRARSDIEDRIRPVNDSLAKSEFNQGRWLRIDVHDATGETVQNFLKELEAAVSGSLATTRADGTDAGVAEERFEKMAALLDRLGSADSADLRWRRQVLDTRKHVSFIGVEYNAAGDVVDTHRDSASLSGGQAQKLVFFCLAAALRYQLAEPDQPVPTYGSVILDEAFDRADPEYTRRAMDVFTSFGFHMILATPLKLIQTLRPYVGGTLVVAYQESVDDRGRDVASTHVSEVEIF